MLSVLQSQPVSCWQYLSKLPRLHIISRSVSFRTTDNGTGSKNKTPDTSNIRLVSGVFVLAGERDTGNHGKSLTAGFPWILSDMQSGSSTSLCRKALHWLCPAQRFTITNKNPRRQTRCEEQCKYSLLCQNQDVWSLPNRKLVTPVVTANQKKR